jgi:hypothetical protein
VDHCGFDFSQESTAPASLLQQRIVRLVPARVRRDTWIQAAGTEGAAAALLLAAEHERRFSARRQSAVQPEGPGRLLLTDAAGLETFRQLLGGDSGRLSIDAPETSLQMVLLGLRPEPRDDLKLLATAPRILAAVPDRLIDHIRRNHIRLGRVEEIVLLMPGGIARDQSERLSMEQDILFIRTKCSRSVRIRLFCEDWPPAAGLTETLRRPLLIPRGRWTAVDGSLKTVHVSEASAKAAEQLINSFPDDVPSVAVYAAPEGKNALEQAGAQNRMDLLCAADPVPPALNPVRVIFFDLGGSPAEHPAVRQLIDRAKGTEFYCLYTNRHQDFRRTLEEYGMMKKTASEAAEYEEVILQALDDLKKAVIGDPNPEELQILRAMIRKNVPFSKRTLIAAYLLRQAAGASSAPPRAKKSPSPQRRQSKSTAESQKNGEGTTLFVGVGKKRRVYAKDLSRHFMEVGGLTDEQILAIKVLNNYSFVTVSPEAADKAVSAVNGSDFHGKPLTCDYARSN